MTIEINVSGRFKVLDQPYALPSKCAFCSLGHNQDGKVSFIDTTLDLDFYGVVYICSNCLTEIAKSLGFIPPEGWQKIVEDSTNSLIENDRLRAENNGLRDAVNILTGHRCVSVQPSNPDIVKVIAEANRIIDRTPKGVESAEPESDALSSEPGLSDVRGTAKLKPAKSSTTKPDDGSDIFDL
jgi:hypothetical protein